jgi:hypothetical protein
METLTQIISALYVALGEAAGGPRAMRVANRVLREAIADHSIDDPIAIQILSALAVDEDELALPAGIASSGLYGTFATQH